MKLTRHNGRSGKHGTYNPRHNDRRFDVENSEHIDAERARQNVYWDCYRGFTTHDFRENSEQPDFSFEEIERMYYYEHYADHVNAQNARNEKTRHIERNRTVDDLLKNNKTCPEESIYQIGTMEESVPPETLALIVSEFYEEFENRFGSHIHILDWALHLDEGTPHIHERHVFDCENRYGELCPQQEKALEELGIPLPKPEQPKGKHNNRKQTFDAVCRIILFDVAKRHGLHLEQEPSYGGRDYLEKQDYISRQKETYRTPYESQPKDRLRQCVFGGSSNTLDFLPLDRAGNRRFLPIMIYSENAEVHILEDEDASRAYLLQVWAEAMTIYRSGQYSMKFSKSIQRQLVEVQKDFMPEDTEAGQIQGFLEHYTGNMVCSKQLFKEALGHTFDQPKRWQLHNINEIMNTVVTGWKPFSNPRMFAGYGRQKGWECDNFDNELSDNEGGFVELSEEECRQLELPKEWIA